MADVDLEQLRLRTLSRLPDQVYWRVHERRVVFDFRRAHSPLKPVSTAELFRRIEPEWARLFVFGDRVTVSAGSSRSLLVVQQGSGVVYGLDPGLKDAPLYLLNSNADAFIDTFLLFDRMLRSGPTSLAALRSEAEQIDPTTFPKGAWRGLADQLLTAQ